jgi:spore maturation protein SpmA
MARKSMAALAGTVPEPAEGVDHLDAAFRAPAADEQVRLTLDVTPDMHLWLGTIKLKERVPIAGLLRAMAATCADDPDLLARVINRAKADAA